MGKMGYGYGSEWQLTRFLGRHRSYFTTFVSEVCDINSLDWLDFNFKSGDWLGDGELLGLAFFPDEGIRTEFRGWWPHGSGIMNWDAVGAGRNADARRSWVLVEAKGNLSELRSSCGAGPISLRMIRSALDETRAACGVDSSGDWTVGYYQHANRLAVLNFLLERGVEVDLVDVYFTGETTSDATSPADRASWKAAIAEMKQHLGLRGDSRVEQRAHEVFIELSGRSVQPVGDSY